MKQYYSYKFTPVDGLHCTLKIIDMEYNDEIIPAIELTYVQNSRKKVSFAMLKDVLANKNLIPELADCLKGLAEDKKPPKIAKCKKCGQDFEKTKPAQKYCIFCRKRKGQTISVGDNETKIKET